MSSGVDGSAGWRHHSARSGRFHRIGAGLLQNPNLNFAGYQEKQLTTLMGWNRHILISIKREIPSSGWGIVDSKWNGCSLVSDAQGWSKDWFHEFTTPDKLHVCHSAPGKVHVCTFNSLSCTAIPCHSLTDYKCMLKYATKEQSIRVMTL